MSENNIQPKDMSKKDPAHVNETEPTDTFQGETEQATLNSEGRTHNEDLSLKIKSLEEELQKVSAAKDENYNKFVRALADLENVKKRSEKEKKAAREYAIENFCKGLLPVLDSFHQALDTQSQQEAGKDQSFYNGMTMVRKLLMETLDKNGMTPVDAKDEIFDPNVHQAIRKIESQDIDQETVEEEYSKGYTLNGRLLRPAMVSVLVPEGQ